MVVATPAYSRLRTLCALTRITVLTPPGFIASDDGGKFGGLVTRFDAQVHRPEDSEP